MLWVYQKEIRTRTSILRSATNVVAELYTATITDVSVLVTGR